MRQPSTPDGRTGFKDSKGIRQASQLATIGFHQVYLFVFVLVDSRERNAGGITYDGLPREMADAIDARISPAGLDPNVGFVHYELVQPMDHEPLGGSGAGGIELLRPVAPIPQSEEVTAWVRSKIREQRTSSRRRS